jgi:hypothetical protein
MAIQTRTEKARYQFCLKDLGPDPDLERFANLMLVQLLALAPPGASAFGFVEKGGRVYRAAVNRVLQKIEDRLYQWRYGGGSSGASAEPISNFNFPQTQG